MQVLVVGLQPLDSGKTRLARGIIKALKSEGYEAAGFKPVAATDIWLNPAALHETRHRRVVVTGDGLSLSEASGGVSPEALNPLAVLLAPYDPSQAGWRITDPWPPGGPEARSVLLRLTACQDSRAHTVHAINMQAVHRVPERVQALVLEAAGHLVPPPRRVDRRTLEDVYRGAYSDWADSCLWHLRERFEALVVESNSDVAAPTPGSIQADLVVAVYPGVAALVDGDRYKRAVEVLAASGRMQTVTAGEAIALAGVTGRIPLPLLGPGEDYAPWDLEAIVDALKESRKAGG